MNGLVLGVGNELRGDDAVGIELARRIARRGLPGIEAESARPDGLWLINRWVGTPRVVLVDAVRSGGPPGSWIRIDAHQGLLGVDAVASSSHRFGIKEAIELARRLGRLPDRLIVLGVEGAQFGLGEGLSEPVKQAMDGIEHAILTELRRED
jgi:hydrogenase maturation protease